MLPGNSVSFGLIDLRFTGGFCVFFLKNFLILLKKFSFNSDMDEYLDFALEAGPPLPVIKVSKEDESFIVVHKTGFDLMCHVLPFRCDLRFFYVCGC